MITKLLHFITKHFKQPIDFYSRPWLIIGLNIILSALIMIFYEPFGYHFDSWAEFTQLIGFCVIAFFSSVLFFLCIPQEPHIKKWMNHWTIGKNCLYSIAFLLFTGISISFYDFHLIMLYRAEDYGTRAFYICLLTDIVGTFTIGIVPLCVGLMLEHSHHLEQNLNDIRKKQETFPDQLDKKPINDTKKISYQNELHSLTNEEILKKEVSMEREGTNPSNDGQFYENKNSRNKINCLGADDVMNRINMPENDHTDKNIPINSYIKSTTETSMPTKPNVILSSNTRNENYKNNEPIVENSVDTLKISEDDETILLTGDTKESLEISPRKILFIEASGNYVNIYYQQTKQTRKILRTTFSNMEKQLANYSFLIKCHRAYMVNKNFITSLERNSQGYHLNLQETTKEIPVSRTFLKDLRAVLQS